MDYLRIKITPEIENGIRIINELDNARFQKFLKHIKEQSSVRNKNEIFTAEEMVALEKVFKLNSEQVLVVIKVTLNILERLSKFVQIPKNIMFTLTKKLKLNTDKAELFIDVWKTVLKDIMEYYNISNFGNINTFVKSDWQLNLTIGSHLNKKEKTTSVLMDIETSENTSNMLNENIIELTTEEFINITNQLENIQVEMDNILYSSITPK